LTFPRRLSKCIQEVVKIVGKNIIICSDGTGNTFEKDQTNVTRLIKHLVLDDRRKQVVVYDQGLGTNAGRVAEVEQFRRNLSDPEALHILPPPLEHGWPFSLVDRLRGLAFGHGLKENLREMYCRLAWLYSGPEDRVFLFGFSRGAFTVRALAGILHRCNLPPMGVSDPEARFEQAWDLFQRMDPDRPPSIRARVDCLRADQRPCRIHFLGLWDTVKSYGGLVPVILPHLRHNPSVDHVRHALALDEERAYYKPTTWGLLDSDGEYGKAFSRLAVEDLPFYIKQDVAEVWFAGHHSDVGGGAEEQHTATITLRWMLGEAVNIPSPLELNPSGRQLLAEKDPDDAPLLHPRGRGWRLLELLPRKEIDNDRQWPELIGARGCNGRRRLEKFRRGGTVADPAQSSLQPAQSEGVRLNPGGTLSVHVTAENLHETCEGIQLRKTLSHPS
jgi:uncharacterized protein (DUF2235 family)